MDQITEQIWLGGSDSAADIERLKRLGITHILNVAQDLPEQASWRDGFTHHHVGLRDASNHPSLYYAAEEVLSAIVDGGHKVVVHCHEGRSRSAFIVALWMQYRGMYPDTLQAEAFLKTKRSCVSINDAHRRSLDKNFTRTSVN